jgi:hypothetical protein
LRENLAQFAKVVEASPDREKDDIFRWRRVDLKPVIAERVGVDFRPRYAEKLSLVSRTSAPGCVIRLRMSGSSGSLKKLSARALKARLAGLSETAPIESGLRTSLDALGMRAGVGQKNGLVRQWARRGTRPRQAADQRYDNAYPFGAIWRRGASERPWRLLMPTPT